MTSKTVYLIRHAESAENVLMQGVVRSLNGLLAPPTRRALTPPQP